MKKQLLIVAISVALPAFAQPKAGPKLVLDSATQDFGNIKQSDAPTWEFKFKNAGNEPLIITACTSSTKVIVADCPKDPLAPGKAGVIKVKLSPSKAGPLSGTVSVNSNAQTPTTLNVKANVAAN